MTRAGSAAPVPQATIGRIRAWIADGPRGPQKDNCIFDPSIRDC
jgi:hypothetical protein